MMQLFFKKNFFNGKTQVIHILIYSAQASKAADIFCALELGEMGVLLIPLLTGVDPFTVR